METFQIQDNVYVLKDSYGNCSNLVIGDNKALLFDTGLGVEDLRSEVNKLTKLPLMVINSHGHLDHVGGNYQFDLVYLNPEDKCIFKNYNQTKLEKWIKAITGKHISLKGKFSPNLNTTDLNFESFDLGNLKCFIVKLAGHSKGSIGIHIPKLKLLLSGDALLPLMTLYFDNYGSINDQLESLSRVSKLNFDYYLTGHSEIPYPKSFIKKLMNCALNSLNAKHQFYTFPEPPYSSGYSYFDSNDDQIGIIVAECNKNLVDEEKQYVKK